MITDFSHPKDASRTGMLRAAKDAAASAARRPRRQPLVAGAYGTGAVDPIIAHFRSINEAEASFARLIAAMDEDAA